MTKEASYFSAGAEFPELGRFIPAAGGDIIAVGTDGDRDNGKLMTFLNNGFKSLGCRKKLYGKQECEKGFHDDKAN